MKRLILAQATAMTGDPEITRKFTVPVTATGYEVIHDFPARNRVLLLVTLPDGTAKTANTIADLLLDENGLHVDIEADPLTNTQRNAVKTFLVNAGYDVSQFDSDGITDRSKLFWFVIRRLAARQDMTPRQFLEGYFIA